MFKETEFMWMMVRMDSGQIVLECRLLLLVQLLFSHGIGPRWPMRNVQYGTRSVDVLNTDLHRSLGEESENICLQLYIYSSNVHTSATGERTSCWAFIFLLSISSADSR